MWRIKEIIYKCEKMVKNKKMNSNIYNKLPYKRGNWLPYVRWGVICILNVKSRTKVVGFWCISECTRK